MTLSSAAYKTHLKERIKLLLALSRTPHGVLDMAAPALAALLCLGAFPHPLVVLVGLITLFSGYTAVYALNDLVDLRTDRQKVRIGGYDEAENYLDGVWIRHPMAKGALRFRTGLAWAAGWTAVAMAGAAWLNPVCIYIFIGGCVLETIYCRLWRVSPLRALVNGVVKTLGPLAAAFAVMPQPPVLFVALLFLWLFFWEIGGQNIPCDWTDIEEDRYFKAQTIPVKLGLRRAGVLCVAALTLAFILNLAVLWASPLHFSWPYLAATVLINYHLLLKPALNLAENRDRQLAMQLFNKASYYPLANLTLVLVNLLPL